MNSSSILPFHHFHQNDNQQIHRKILHCILSSCVHHHQVD
ncbi:hypothetical protein Mgra_00009510, partial [Meloidogyne graminicola]